MTLLGLIVLLIILNVLPQLGVKVPGIVLSILNIILGIALLIFLLDITGLLPLFNRPLIVRQ